MNYNSSKILKLFFLTIIVIIAILGNNAYKIAKKRYKQISEDYLTVDSGSRAIDELTFITDSLTRQNKELFTILKDITSNGLHDKSKAEDSLLAICKVQVEDATSNIDASDAYKCLSQIYKDKNTQTDHIKSINYSSRALNLYYDKGHVKNIYEVILKNTTPDIEIINRINTILDLSNTNDEVDLLKYIINKSNDETKAKAFYRLSNIYQNGKSSVNSNEIKINLAKTINYRSKALEIIDITKRNVIDVAFIFDDPYLPHAASTIASLLLNADPETYYNIHIIQNPENLISENGKNKLLSMKYISDFDMNFIIFPEGKLNKHLEYESGFLPDLVYYRVFLKEVLNIPKVIYLDSDIIISRDLLDLFNKGNDNNYYISGALDQFPFYCSIGRKLTKKCINNKLFYINAGIFLINLDYMDNYNKLTNDINDIFINSDCPKQLRDQDMINFTFGDKINFISRKWNFKPNNIPDMFITHYYVTKPWNYPKPETSIETWKKNPEKMLDQYKLYWIYRDITPWHVNTDIIEQIQK